MSSRPVPRPLRAVATVAAVAIVAAAPVPPLPLAAQTYTPLTREEQRQLIRSSTQFRIRQATDTTALARAASRTALAARLRALPATAGRAERAALRDTFARAQDALRDSLRQATADSLATWGIGADVPLLQAFGVGSVNLADIAQDPSAQLMVNFAIFPRSNLFLSFNKGAGVTRQAADSLDLRSLIFPATGDVGFVASFSGPLSWLPMRRVPGYRLVADRAQALAGHDVNWALSAFSDVSVQKRTVAARERGDDAGGGAAGDSLTVSRSFDALQWHIGPKLQVAYYPAERGRITNGFRLTAGLSFAYLRVTNSSKDAFRTIFGGAVPTDSVLPRIFRGPAFKVGVELNGIAIESEFTGYRAQRGEPRLMRHVPGITGTQIIVRTNVAAPILEF